MSTKLDDIPYVPAPSTGHEIGVMFGFIGAMLLSMITYAFVWQAGNKRSARKEEERISALKASGWLKEKAPFSEEEKVEVAEGSNGSGVANGARDEVTEIKM